MFMSLVSLELRGLSPWMQSELSKKKRLKTPTQGLQQELKITSCMFSSAHITW